MMGHIDSYYAATAKGFSEYPRLQGEQTADVCIVGAGFTGLSAALHLAEQGHSVVLLDAERVGWGASGRNGGQVCQGHNMDHDELSDALGKDGADRLWQLSLESVDLVKALIAKHKIDCDLKSGVLHVANKAGHAKEMQASVRYKQDKLHYNAIRYVDRQEVADLLGTDHYHGGEYWQDAAHLHPLNYALGLANACTQAGVAIFEQSRVTEIQKNAAGVVVKTAQGHVRAASVVLACNGYLEKLEPRIAGKIMPINNFILATEPLPDALAHKINRDDVAVADSRFVINYFKLSADNRLLWGGGENYTRRFPSDIKQFVRKHMLEFYPELQDVQIDYGWGGTLAITLNRMPHFARLDQHTWVAQGYSGHGVALATLGGKLLAEAIGGQSERFETFTQLPTRTFPGGTLLRWPGLVAGMLYYALRDRL